jgi:hypothetical protein
VSREEKGIALSKQRVFCERVSAVEHFGDVGARLEELIRLTERIAAERRSKWRREQTGG